MSDETPPNYDPPGLADAARVQGEGPQAITGTHYHLMVPISYGHASVMGPGRVELDVLRSMIGPYWVAALIDKGLLIQETTR